MSWENVWMCVLLENKACFHFTFAGLLINPADSARFTRNNQQPTISCRFIRIFCGIKDTIKERKKKNIRLNCP